MLITIKPKDKFTLANVIFLHGLNGDPLVTWGLENREENWANWLLSAEPNLSILSVGYEVKSSRWIGTAMPIYDRAINVLAQIDHLIDITKPSVFLCHSYGGILFKQMIRYSMEMDKFSYLARNKLAVAFFGTPNNGSILATLIDKYIPLFKATIAMRELGSDEPYLLDLNRWFRSHAMNNKINVEVFIETRKTSGALVVGASSSDPALVGVVPIAIDANHIELSKPINGNDLRVERVRELLTSLIRENVEMPASDSRTFELVLQRIRKSAADGAPLKETDLEELIQFRDNWSSEERAKSAYDCVQRLIDICNEYSNIESGMGQAIFRRKWANQNGMTDIIYDTKDKYTKYHEERNLA